MERCEIKKSVYCFINKKKCVPLQEISLMFTEKRNKTNIYINGISK